VRPARKLEVKTLNVILQGKMYSKFFADAASYVVKFQRSCCAEGKDMRDTLSL